MLILYIGIFDITHDPGENKGSNFAQQGSWWKTRVISKHGLIINAQLWCPQLWVILGMLEQPFHAGRMTGNVSRSKLRYKMAFLMM